jgi:hypothetical protein
MRTPDSLPSANVAGNSRDFWHILDTVSRLGSVAPPCHPISWESVQKASEKFRQAFQKVQKRINFLQIASEKFTGKPRAVKDLRLKLRQKTSKFS